MGVGPHASSSSDSGSECVEMSALMDEYTSFPSPALSLCIEGTSHGYSRVLFWAGADILALSIAFCVPFLGDLDDVPDYGCLFLHFGVSK